MSKKDHRTFTTDRSFPGSERSTGDSLVERIGVWLRTAAEKKVVVRAFVYAVVVGAILVAINHGDAILAGHVDASRWVRITLTVLVPYCVSTASSVGAILELRPGAAS